MSFLLGPIYPSPTDEGELGHNGKKKRGCFYSALFFVLSLMIK